MSEGLNELRMRFQRSTSKNNKEPTPRDFVCAKRATVVDTTTNSHQSASSHTSQAHTIVACFRNECSPEVVTSVNITQHVYISYKLHEWYNIQFASLSHTDFSYNGSRIWRSASIMPASRPRLFSMMPIRHLWQFSWDIGPPNKLATLCCYSSEPTITYMQPYWAHLVYIEKHISYWLSFS